MIWIKRQSLKLIVLLHLPSLTCRTCQLVLDRGGYQLGLSSYGKIDTSIRHQCTWYRYGGCHEFVGLQTKDEHNEVQLPSRHSTFQDKSELPSADSTDTGFLRLRWFQPYIPYRLPSSEQNSSTNPSLQWELEWKSFAYVHLSIMTSQHYQWWAQKFWWEVLRAG